jgi:hypothetical protein
VRGAILGKKKHGEKTNVDRRNRAGLALAVCSNEIENLFQVKKGISARPGKQALLPISKRMLNHSGRQLALFPSLGERAS